jgi:hypothetical protein
MRQRLVDRRTTKTTRRRFGNDQEKVNGLSQGRIEIWRMHLLLALPALSASAMSLQSNTKTLSLGGCNQTPTRAHDESHGFRLDLTIEGDIRLRGRLASNGVRFLATTFHAHRSNPSPREMTIILR